MDASESQVPEMLQALLEERFKLKVHRGNANQEVFALVVAKGGLKVREAIANSGIAAVEEPPASTSTFFGSVTTREIFGQTGRHSAAAISNPRMGTVIETNGANRLQRWEAPNITFEGLADLLDKVMPLSSPVIDMTGLKGRYQLVLEVTIAGGDPTELDESVLKAVNEGLRKLGLQLERRQGAVEILVVDYAAKTPSEN